MKQNFSANLAIHSSFVQQLANRDLTTKLMVASGFSYYDGFCIFLKLLKDTAFVEVSFTILIMPLNYDILFFFLIGLKVKENNVHIYFLYMHINLKSIWEHREIEISENFFGIVV